MKYVKLLLWPFSLLYGGIMLLRNSLYDIGFFGSKRFAIPVLAVGNLTVGGTGKTPHVEYLLRLLQGYRLATLSRGYKRKSKGFVLADDTATASTLGDEPYQYHRDFPDVTVAVCESRVAGIERLRMLRQELEAVVLDDALQHRAVEPSLRILLTDFTRPFYSDFVLPAGLLREPRGGARRADCIVVSKCPPELTLEEQQAITQKIRRYSRPETPIFFSTFRYGQPVPIGSAAQLSDRIILLTGIANAAPLVDYLNHRYTITQHLEYADHYSYTLQDLAKLQQLTQGHAPGTISIVTTRKDAVKLADTALQELTQQLPLFYIPIEVDFLRDRDRFDELVLGHMATFRKQ